MEQQEIETLADTAVAVTNYLQCKPYSRDHITAGRMVLEKICPQDGVLFFLDTADAKAIREAARRAIGPPLRDLSVPVPQNRQQLAERFWQATRMLGDIECAADKQKIDKRRRRLQWMIPFMADFPARVEHCRREQFARHAAD